MAEQVLESNVKDTALIFEGGGMRAAYTAPVVTELIKQQVFIDWVAGISAGATNAANYITRDLVRARRCFVEFALDPNFGNLRTWARGDGLFNANYIYQRTSEPGQSLPFDWDVFEKNPINFRIGGFRADDGQEVYWGREDIDVPKDFLVRVQASSTMPVFMPPVEIDGQTYVDGALGPSGGIALDAARADGFEKFLVVLTRPRDYVKKPFRADAVTRRVFKEFPSVTEALMERPGNYNRTREELFDLEAEGKAYVFAPTGYTVNNQERRFPRLEKSYADGTAQIRSEMPAIKEFLGLA
mgnify:FL=1